MAQSPERSTAVSNLSRVLEDKLQPYGELCVQLEDYQKELQEIVKSISFGGVTSDGIARFADARNSARELETACSMAKGLLCLLEVHCNDAKRNFNDTALRIGFSSVPDEILSEILVLATRPQSIHFHAPLEIDAIVELKATLEARSLSHVCRHFRSLLLKASRIWSVLSEHMIDTSKIRTCIERSRRTPVDILLEYYGLRQGDFAQFFKFCLLSASHWRSLTIGRPTYVTGDQFHPRRKWERIRQNLDTMDQLSGQLTLPSLERLIICFGNVDSSEHRIPEFHPYWRWSMPSLVDLRIIGCRPPPADASFGRSLRYFSLRFTTGVGDIFDLAQLAKFLSSCQVLEKVDINFVCWNVKPCALHGIVSVQEVAFSFQRCGLEQSTAIYNSIYFPHASKVRLYLWRNTYLKDASGNEKKEREGFIRELLRRHPLTKTFHLDYCEDHHSFVPISPPITVLPALEKLKLSFNSWKELVFKYEDRLPSIRILELHVWGEAENSPYLKSWVEKFLGKLKEQGDLDSLKQLAVYETSDRLRPLHEGPSLLKNLVDEYLPPEKIFFGFKPM